MTSEASARGPFARFCAVPGPPGTLTGTAGLSRLPCSCREEVLIIGIAVKPGGPTGDIPLKTQF